MSLVVDILRGIQILKRMIIKQFDTQIGFYIFEESNLTTQMHAHPILEIVVAQQGYFSLATPKKRLENLELGLIKPNQIHQLDAQNCSFELILLERTPSVLIEILAFLNVEEGSEGIVVIDGKFKNSIYEKIAQTVDNQIFINYDSRILACLNFIKQHLHTPKIVLSDLSNHVHLSPSRLSHLFQQQMGVTIQKYIIWERMKTTIQQVIEQNLSLTEAAYAAGFYDTAHFSKHFKEFFGVSPSSVYNNSRIVQV
jgi:AraC-like DNA-binding protein